MSLHWSNPQPDTGVGAYRTAHPASEREKVLADLWREWNSRDRFSGGLLDCLVLGDHGPGRSPTAELGFQFERRITRRERAVAATVVQWLGTNVGTSFLGEAFTRSAKLRSEIAAKCRAELESDRWNEQEARLKRIGEVYLEALSQRDKAIADKETLSRALTVAKQVQDEIRASRDAAVARVNELSQQVASLELELANCRSAVPRFVRGPGPAGPRKLIVP